MGLGITFKPTEQSGQMGPGQAAKEGGLQQAIQLLSLRYPKVGGARSPVGSPSLLAGGASAAPRMTGFNPNAAIFQALIKAYSEGQGGQGMSQPMQSHPLAGAASAFSQGVKTSPSFQFEQPGGAGSAPSRSWSGESNDVLTQVNTSGMTPRTSWGDQLSRKLGSQFL